MSDRETLMRRIEKLLALGASPNEHEAASAMAMAQRLMAEHQLSTLDVECAKIGHKLIKSPFSVSTPKTYENALAWTVVKAFGCDLLWLPSRAARDDIYGKWIFIGPRDRLAVAEHFFVVLQRKLLTGRAEFVKKLPRYLTAKQKTIEGNGWCVGYVTAVKNAVVEVAGTQVSSEAMAKYKTEVLRPIDKPAAKDRGRIGAAGYDAGTAAGEAERLHRPMTGDDRMRIGVS